MSTLNLGNSPILKPMEHGSGTLTATNFSVTYEYYKKDNVVNLSVSFDPTGTINAGTFASTSTALPSNIRPLFSQIKYISHQNPGSATTFPFNFVIYNTGTIGIFFFTGITAAWGAVSTSFTYLVND